MSGPPSTFTQEIADLICEKLASGQSLASMCGSDGIPNKWTVYHWLRLFPDFAEQYTMAREDQAETLADEIVAIADDSASDVADDGKVNSENIQRSRLRVDARKWVAAHLRPKKYGDRLIAEHSGPDGSPIRMEHSNNLSDLSAEERDVIRKMVERRAKPVGWVEGEPDDE